MKLDVELSAKTAKLVKPKKQQCYTNSFGALSYLPEGTMYVEGYGLIEKLGVPLEHGWCLLSDGETVVDVTWFDAAPVRYQPLRVYQMAELLDLLEKDRMMPVTWRHHQVTAQEHLEAIKKLLEG